MGQNDCCCVPGCYHMRSKNDNRCRYHVFPTKPEVRDKWVKAINREVVLQDGSKKLWEPGNSARVCSCHFSQLPGTVPGKQCVPDIFPDTPNREKRAYKEKASPPGEPAAKTAGTPVVRKRRRKVGPKGNSGTPKAFRLHGARLVPVRLGTDGSVESFKGDSVLDMADPEDRIKIAEAEKEQLTESLGLVSHPEGGHFLELYRSSRQMESVNEEKDSPHRHAGPRCAGTSIHYLMEKGQFVSWHKHKSDALFLWHRGGPAKFHQISPDGSYSCVSLGDHFEDKDLVYQVTIAPGTWYAAELEEGAEYILWSCVIIPGFEFSDWTAGLRSDLIKMFPQHEDLITKFTKT